ncbi:unnamed protein product [Ostreobium quekettii]|uniref:Uncharacterized protein n=1 Tax=Ostreobium quekettii TaxID=121088 RepID=A0A8S1J9W2_9CHLO|nr:unnamed protein product [Ostreobium quekettii]
MARREGGGCKGYGFVKLADSAAAEKACKAIRQIAGVPVGVHFKVGGQPGESRAVYHPVLQFSLDRNPSASINVLLQSLRPATDKKAVVAAAIKAVKDRMAGVHLDGDEDKDKATGERRCATLALDMASYLDSFPKCKSLMVNMRACPGFENKTPLAVLHEYAIRLDYQGKAKKDAKQIASAATLEVLLETVAEDQFMQPGKARQQRMMQGTHGRGRGGYSNWNGGGWNGGGRGYGNGWNGHRGGAGYQGRGGRPSGMRSSNCGVRGGREAGRKRDYESAMLGLQGQANVSCAPHMKTPNLAGLVGGGAAQGGLPLSPLTNQGIGAGTTGMGMPAMMTGMTMGGPMGGGMQGDPTNTIGGGLASAMAGGLANTMVTGNINTMVAGTNMMGTMTMGNLQAGTQTGGVMGVGNGSTSISPVSHAGMVSGVNGTKDKTMALGRGMPPLTPGPDALVSLGASMGLSAGQQTSAGLLNWGTGSLGHAHMAQPNGAGFLGTGSFGQQAQLGRFGF